MNHFSKIVLTTIITSLGVAIPAMSMETMELKATDVANSKTTVTPQVTFNDEQPTVEKKKRSHNKKLSKHARIPTDVEKKSESPTNLVNEVENTVEVIKEALPTQITGTQNLSDLSTELSTIIDKGSSCCLWCISETTQIAQDLNRLVVEISKTEQAIESNVTAVTQLVDTIKDFNKLTPKEQKLQKNNLKVNMKNAKVELVHHKVLQKNKPANNENKADI